MKNYKEFVDPACEERLREQASRCMNCGIPYCHNGCPVNNIIPDWNHLVYEDDWKNALEVLHSTNNFPEFTGRICPAPCEASCTLNIIDQPVTIKSIECAIVDRGWKEGWIEPQVPEKRTGKTVAVVGSGPAGLACAQQLARAGHSVTLFEKSDRIGGLLRYGIPDFKMEKHLINRRLVQMEAEGVTFKTSTEVGVDISFKTPEGKFRRGRAVGRRGRGAHAQHPGLRDARRAPGDGIPDPAEQAQCRRRRNARRPARQPARHRQACRRDRRRRYRIDCVGTSNRQGAASVTQIEIMPKPPEQENKLLTWPDWPMKLRTSSSHEEGVDRDWAVLTKEVVGENGKVTGLKCVRADWSEGQLKEVAGQRVRDQGRSDPAGDGLRRAEEGRACSIRRASA